MSTVRAGRRRTAAFRPSPVFLGVVALWLTGGVLAWLEYGSPVVNVLLFVLAGWIVSLSLHEYAHALTAYRSGDHSVAARGYLTLNPLTYTHPLLSIVFPLIFLLIGGIGLPGGAVWVNRDATRSRGRASLISLVGPGANVVFLLVLAVPFLIGIDTRAHPTFWAAVAFLAFLQLTAAALNLLPVPGLDGGNALRPWLRGDTAKVYDYLAPFGFLLLVAILFTPVVSDIFWGTVLGVADVLGVPRGLIRDGLNLVQFWR
ncbi:MAG: site-2 protease family protein [Micromonosporaceae bacterium]|nr:site-2 protease family protein [Micromonosporaceae bacterium]